jgi:hypothetical protein
MIAIVTSHKLRKNSSGMHPSMHPRNQSGCIIIKTLGDFIFINTQLISKMYKGIRNKGEFK